jgi:oligopeptide/dipeptide ABC transporter ATP-binding protein
MTPPVLEVRHLSKVFPARGRLFGRRPPVRAVQDVSFAIQPGETLGLVGESGSGKSTLGRTILRLTDPTSGEILFDGRPVGADDTDVLRRGAQIVFQDPYASLPPKMRVRRILADPLLIHRIVDPSETGSRVDALLADVGLSGEHARAFPHQLSGGQRQRVSIARALAVEPSLVVADEAVSALDVSVQAQILNLMRDLQTERGLAYLFISHDVGVVRYMSRRIAVMYRGRIVEVGPAAEVATAPLHPYTATLLAAVPNLGPKRTVVRVDTDPGAGADLEQGCSYRSRCPMAQDICVTDRPDLVEWAPGRRSACHFAFDMPQRLGATVPAAGGAG